MADCANSLFVSFLKELKAEARQSNSRVLIQSYTKAIQSMEKYPVPLTRGEDALILAGVGEYIAKRLDEKLDEYLALRSAGVFSRNLFSYGLRSSTGLCPKQRGARPTGQNPKKNQSTC